MKNTMKICFAVLLLAVLCLCGCALAQESVIQSKEIEKTMTYEDETIRVTIDQWHYAYKGSDLRFFLAHIYTQRPDQLQTAFAGEEYSKDLVEPTRDIADRHGAVVAINGDYYNYKDNLGVIIRNGILYRDKDMSGNNSVRDMLLIDSNGQLSAIKAQDFVPGQGQKMLDEGIQQCFVFGPLLVEDGQATTFPKKYVIYTKENIREPRTAIGQVDDNHYVVLVADGRRDVWSDKGMTLREMQQVFIEQGCRIAYNMDGGGSATLVMNGEQINKTSGSRERNVSDIIYFTK